jgi:hypothetical protein
MMKTLTIKLAVIGALGLISTQASAAFEPLPTTGFAVGANTSPYRLCNTTGDFGSGIATKPTSVSDPCAVMPSSEAIAPDTNFSGASAFPVASNIRNIIMNNSYTGGTDKHIGTLTQYMWQRVVSTGVYECIYGTKVVLNSTDYNTTAGNVQNFEVNGIALGGWGTLDVDVAYSTVPTVSEPVYRVGRTFTSVQRRDETGYVSQPLTTPAMSPVESINGVNVWPTPSGEPTAVQQSATLNSNWIEFTTDANYKDDDGSTAAASGMVYVRTGCTSAIPTEATPEAIRLRQTFQERAGDSISPNPFIEVPVAGFLPSSGSGSLAPAHKNDY